MKSPFAALPKLPRKVTRASALTVALVGVLLGTAACVESSPAYLNCYEAKSEPFEPLQVSIQDRYRTYEDVKISDVARLCQFVEVDAGEGDQQLANHEFNEFVGVEWYRLPRQPGRPLNDRLTVNNVFGEGQQITVLRPMFVGTFTLAAEGEVGFPLESEIAGYTCYSARGRRSDREVALFTQGSLLRETRVLEPAFVCIDAMLWFGETSDEPAGLLADMVCYNTRVRKEPVREVSTFNQLTGEGNLSLTGSSMVCASEGAETPVD